MSMEGITNNTINRTVTTQEQGLKADDSMLLNALSSKQEQDTMINNESFNGYTIGEGNEITVDDAFSNLEDIDFSEYEEIVSSDASNVENDKAKKSGRQMTSFQLQAYVSSVANYANQLAYIALGMRNGYNLSAYQLTTYTNGIKLLTNHLAKLSKAYGCSNGAVTAKNQANVYQFYSNYSYGNIADNDTNHDGQLKFEDLFGAYHAS